MPDQVLAYDNQWYKAPDASVTVCDDWRFKEYYSISGEQLSQMLALELCVLIAQ